MAITNARVEEIRLGSALVVWDTDTTGEFRVRLYRDQIGQNEQDSRTLTVSSVVQPHPSVRFDGLEHNQPYTAVIEGPDGAQGRVSFTSD